MTSSGVDAAFARARSFVAGLGDGLARVRAGAVLGDVPPGALSAALRARQAEDGSFGLAGDAVAGTFSGLAVLADADVVDGPEVARAVAWLESRQEADGGWSPPPGAAPGARLVLAGLVAGLLARGSCARGASLARAGRLLAEGWTPDRVRGGDFGMIAAYAGFFARTPHPLSDAGLQWCGRELERAFRSGRLGPLQTARVLVLADAPALPGGRIPPEDLVAALLETQSDDGGWLGGEAPAVRRADATVEALVALRRLARRRPETLADPHLHPHSHSRP
jgi:hypothetical protein